MTLENRYMKDPVFFQAVNAMEKMINEETGLTSLDIRDAAFYARVRYEMRHPRPISISPQMADLLRRETER